MVEAHAKFVVLSDKHHIKVGEPGFLVLTAERMWKGNHSIQPTGLAVADHGFTEIWTGKLT